MRVVSPAFAAFVILAGSALAGCGQRGPLYLPTVPPAPAKPAWMNPPPAASDAQEPSDESSSGSSSIDDTSSAPLQLAPADQLHTTPDANSNGAANGTTNGAQSPRAASAPNAD